MQALQATAGATLARHDARRQAEQTAEQFEAILVRQMVSGLRQSAKVAESEGMFGGGVGSDTYGDWFDQHLAEHIGSSGQMGIKQAILDGIERAGQLPPNKDADSRSPDAMTPAQKVRFAAQMANQANPMPALSNGGFDVTQ